MLSSTALISIGSMTAADLNRRARKEPVALIVYSLKWAGKRLFPRYGTAPEPMDPWVCVHLCTPADLREEPRRALTLNSTVIKFEHYSIQYAISESNSRRAS